MTFVNFVVLGFMGVLAAPIIIHLISFGKFQPAEIGTLRFLQLAVSMTKARTRISRWLLLLLRLLCVAAAVFVFSRPFIPELSSPSGTAWLVLIDASGSMNVRSGSVTHFELAMRRAKRLITQVDDKDTVRIWLCAEEIREIAPQTLDQEVKKVIPAGHINWQSTLQRAAATMGAIRASDCRVTILTDMQRVDLPNSKTLEPIKWPKQISVEVECLVHGNWNAELVSASWGAQIGNTTGLDVAVAIHGTVPSSDQLSLETWMDRQRISSQFIPAVSGMVHLLVPEPTAEKRMLEIRLVANDCLAEDDHLWILQPLLRPMPVWLMESRVNPDKYSSEAYFLNKALLATPTGLRAAFEPVLSHDLNEINLEKIASNGNRPASVILCDYGPIDAANLPLLIDKVGPSLGLIIFLGARADAKSCVALHASGLLPAIPTLIQAPVLQSVTWWDVSHPALSRYNLDRAELSGMSFLSRHDLSPLVKGGATVLMKLADDTVCATESHYRNGRVMVVAAQPTRTDSDWVIQRAFAPLIRELVSAGAQLSIAADWKIVDRRFTDTAGFGPDLSQKRILRFPSGEGDLLNANETKFRDDLYLPEHRTPVRAHQFPEPRQGAQRANELWAYFALALLFLMSIEIVVSDKRWH